MYLCVLILQLKMKKARRNTGMWSDFWFKLAIIVMIISQDQGRGQRDMCESAPHHPLGVWGRHDGMQAVVETRERAWHRTPRNERELLHP